jgi:hypothetical protein
MEKKLTLREHLWLWAMKVNILQDLGQRGEGWSESTMTCEQAIARSGIKNVMLCGRLEPTPESLALIPSATRIYTKWGMHDADPDGKGAVMAYDEAYDAMLQAKEIAAIDTRVEGYLLDDFSTGTVDAGVKPEHLAKLQRANASIAPQLPLMGTIYTMSLDRPEMPGLLPFFASYLTPLWHAADIDGLEADVDRLADMSGGKPQMLCIYLWDFGNGKQLSYKLMERQLEVLAELIHKDKVFGVCILGQCMMDLDWEANRALYDWLDKKGDELV